MKRTHSIIYLACVLVATSFFSCKKFEVETAAMTPVDLGTTISYASLPENSMLSIPIKYTSTCDSGISSAVYKVVNNRVNDITLVQSPGVPISFHGKSIDTTIQVPVRRGLLSVVIVINDKCGHFSSKSVDVKSVTPSSAAVKTIANVVMSTDPADNQNFFSFYDTIPVFGQATALAKQGRVDFIAINMNGARFIATNAYAADANYYNASKTTLAGFTTLNYTFLSATKSYVNRTNFDAIATEADLAKYLQDTVIAIAPLGGANYNILNADRRVSDVYGAGNTLKGFVIGWGYRSHPTATASILTESFALVLVKSVTQKPNGQYVITFDIKGPATDQRGPYSSTPISPYLPYPL